MTYFGEIFPKIIFIFAVNLFKDIMGDLIMMVMFVMEIGVVEVVNEAENCTRALSQKLT